MEQPLEPGEIQTLSEIIVNVALFIAGWITRLLTTKRIKNGNNR